LPGSRVGAFGEKFRKQRERRAFSLDDVANVTKIGSRMLKAIEEERFEQLPGGVFNKGFIRTYAKHLGLNHDDAIAEYLELLRQRQADAQGVLTAGQPAQKQNIETTPKNSKGAGNNRLPVRPAKPSPPPAKAQSEDDELPYLHLPKAEHIRPRRLMPGGDRSGISWTVPALLLLLVFSGVYLWSRHLRSLRAEAGDPPPAPAAASSPAPQPLLAQPPVPAQPGPSQSLSAQPAGNASLPAPLPVPHDVEENDVTTKNLNSATSATPAEGRPALTLVIRAAENSWVSVTADGQHVTQETLIAPAHTSVRANREIIVKAGNAAAVSFLLNGKEYPAQGNEGEVRTFVFDASGMHPAPAAQASEGQH
jgi:cytoskeletal protein RodZ